jgi:hypothetical protein
VARLGLFDPELRHETLFDDTLVLEGWFDPELIGTGGPPPSTAPYVTFISIVDLPEVRKKDITQRNPIAFAIVVQCPVAQIVGPV